MKEFKGFPGGKTGITRIPDIFLLDLLPQLKHPGEIKVILYAFWRLDKSEGAFRFITVKDFSQNEQLMQGLDENPETAVEILNDALALACDHNIFLKITPKEGIAEPLYFLNSPKGRAAVHAIQEGKWVPDLDKQISPETLKEPLDIFRLYEENIGVITPLIADSLQEAEKTYPKAWLVDAIAIAAIANKRSWSYINAILRRWQAEGRNEREDRRDSEENYKRYIEGEYKEFIEH
jgi:DNA replication protein